MAHQPTLLGAIQDVRGGTLSVALDANTLSGLTFIDGQGYRIGQVGTFVKISVGYVQLFGVVSEVGSGPSAVTTEEGSDSFGRRWLRVELVGESRRGVPFVRGISQFPAIGDEVHLVTTHDLELIYGRPDEERYVQIGFVANSESIPALIDIDLLLSRHSAVLGTTGAGKSTTVAGLLNSVADSALFPSARIVLVDIHGEYASALDHVSTVFRLTPIPSKKQKSLVVPYWALSFDEFVQVAFGTLEDQPRAAISEQVRAMKVAALRKTPRAGITETTVTVDSPIPFSIHQLWFELHCQVNSTHTQPATGQSSATQAFVLNAQNQPEQPGNALNVIPPRYKVQNQSAGGGEKVFLSGSPLNIRRQLETLASRLRDPRYDFLFRPGDWLPDIDGNPKEDLDTLLESWLGSGKSIAILDLSGVPSTILSLIVGAMLRLIYDSMFWARNLSEGSRERPLLLVLEEAHAYLSGENSASQAVRRIAKEGRKYGLGMMIVSQRPSEIDSTILSQCGTLFAMRLSNPADRSHVSGAVIDNFQSLLDTLPMLRVGEAIVVGEAVHLPMRARISPPDANRRPDSQDPKVVIQKTLDGSPISAGGWNRPREPSKYSDVVQAWRSQNPRSPSVKD